MRTNDTSYEDHLSPFGADTGESWETEGEAWGETEEGEWESDELGEHEAEEFADSSAESMEWEDEESFELEEEDESFEDRELDPAVAGFVERIMAREVFEHEKKARWTTCFTSSDIASLEQAYKDNATAAAADNNDRCSCIVMLNVGLAKLLSLATKKNPARSSSARRVDMARLTTESIEKAMAQLVAKGMAVGPKKMYLLTAKGRIAGTLRPEKLKASVQTAVIDKSTDKCWSAFGLSLMDGYHSVMLLVDRTGPTPKIFWLDQFSPGVTVDVTTTLDDRILTSTQSYWDGVKARKGYGYRTTIRIWQLRKRA